MFPRKPATCAEIVRLDGAVEISVQLGVADAIADIVSSGHPLRRHGLVTVGDPIRTGEAVVVDRANADVEPAKEQFLARIRGVVVAQQYVMLEYVCRGEEPDAADELTPGLESPTILALADDRWISVRAMACRKNVPTIMDRMAAAGAKAIVSSDVCACRL